MSNDPPRTMKILLELAGCLMMVSSCSMAVSAEWSEDVRALIRRAGNAESDSQRLAILKRLSEDTSLDETAKADARRLAEEVERWTTTKYLPYFSRNTNPETGYPFGIAKESPLYPITQFYLGRMLTWRTLESGNIIRYPDVRRKWLGRAVREFQAASKAFP
jgi:hypothetical protein